jgi:hypothetical protein
VPQREGLQFGGVIGSVVVRDIVSRSDSPWFRKGATTLVFTDARPKPVHAGVRPERPVLGPVAMIRIAISAEAFEAIAVTLPLGSVGFENKTDEHGQRLIWLDHGVVARLKAMRGPGESYSDVILRLVEAALP